MNFGHKWTRFRRLLCSRGQFPNDAQTEAVQSVLKKNKETWDVVRRSVKSSLDVFKVCELHLRLGYGCPRA